MVFCNDKKCLNVKILKCHNPYFNRWFSAIQEKEDKIVKTYGHNPYFNRWFSAIQLKKIMSFLMG